MKNKLITKLSNSPLIKQLNADLKERSKPLIEYWLRLSSREQNLLMGAGIIIVATLIFSILSSVVALEQNLRQEYVQSQQYRLDAETMAKQYKNLNSITSNDFSSVNGDKIKGDVSQALNVKNADVLISNNTLTINVANAKFGDVILLLDQLRKSYGLFPDKLKITRLSQSGFVAFTASFTVSN